MLESSPATNTYSVIFKSAEGCARKAAVKQSIAGAGIVVQEGV